MKNIGLLKAMALCREYEKMNAEEREKLRTRRLKELVAFAGKNSPFFRELYRNIPFFSIFLAMFSGTLCSVLPKKAARIVNTAVISVICAAAGIILSILFSTPVGSTIVVSDMAVFFLFSLIARCKGGRHA